MKYCLIILLLNSTLSFSQPYIDLLNLRYVNSPGSIRIPNQDKTEVRYEKGHELSVNDAIYFKISMGYRIKLD